MANIHQSTKFYSIIANFLQSYVILSSVTQKVLHFTWKSTPPK